MLVAVFFLYFSLVVWFGFVYAASVEKRVESEILIESMNIGPPNSEEGEGA